MSIKRFVTILLFVTVFLTFTPSGTFAKTIESGYLTFGIYGSGDAYVSDCDTSAYGTIRIPSSIDGCPVVAIGSNAFSNCSSIEKIVIPYGVQSILYESFSGCSSLTEINIPSSVTSVGGGAFRNCTKLASITIPEGSDIEASAFENTNLKSISIPGSVENVAYYTFRLCSSLNTVVLNEGVTKIDSSAFKGCIKLEAIHIPSTLSKISSYAFEECCSVKKIYLKDIKNWCEADIAGHPFISSKDTLYHKYYFNGNEIVGELEIPEGTKSIGNRAFCFGENITSVIIPNSVTEIGSYAFSGCSNLNDIYYTGSETEWNNITVGTSPFDSTDYTIHYNYENGTTSTTLVTGITLNKSSVTLDIDSCEVLTATIVPDDATNQNVEWTSSNTSVATVENGTVTAVGAGTAIITVTTEDGGYSTTCTVTVNEPEPPTIFVTGILLDKISLTLDIGSNETLITTIAPTDATNQNVEWTSSNTSVATVENGTVTAVGAGTAIITATTEDGGYTATCAITVNSIVEPEVPIEPAENEPTLSVGKVTGKSGETVTVSVTIENNPGILGMMLNISYDEELTLTALAQSTGEDDSALESLDFTPGKNLTENPINVGWDGLDADSTNGKILNMTFAIPEDAEDGNIYNIVLSYTAGNVYDNDFNDIDLAIINGSITVKNYTIGDVNDDGIINMKDVTLLRRGVIGGYGVTLNEAADVNCDGVTNMKDVTILRRYVIGGYGVTLG